MITIRGARTHNLKNLSLTIPDNQITVITGVSGSGKSSLAFDTLFAEGQRRYLDALSLSARQWLDQLPRPDVDWISGLRPAIALTQQTLNASPRSTVGTMSEVLDALRLLFARLGTPHCPHHPDEPLARHSLAEIRDTVLNRWEGARIALLVPKRALPNHLTTFEALRAAGYARLWQDQQTVELESCFGPIPENAAVVIDRLKVRPEQSARLTDSLEHALTLGSGTALVCDLDQGATLRFDTHPTCPRCGFTANELEPHHLSFNHPAGACPTCHGLGMIERAQPPQTASTDPPTSGPHPPVPRLSWHPSQPRRSRGPIRGRNLTGTRSAASRSVAFCRLRMVSALPHPSGCATDPSVDRGAPPTDGCAGVGLPHFGPTHPHPFRGRTAAGAACDPTE
jgi:excinuclease ABC subunit A